MHIIFIAQRSEELDGEGEKNMMYVFQNTHLILMTTSALVVTVVSSKEHHGDHDEKNTHS